MFDDHEGEATQVRHSQLEAVLPLPRPESRRIHSLSLLDLPEACVNTVLTMAVVPPSDDIPATAPKLEMAPLVRSAMALHATQAVTRALHSALKHKDESSLPVLRLIAQDKYFSSLLDLATAPMSLKTVTSLFLAVCMSIFPTCLEYLVVLTPTFWYMQNRRPEWWTYGLH